MSDPTAFDLRGTFHDRYAISASLRDKRSRWPRLLECVTCIVQFGDTTYFQPREIGEFVVVDMRTKEKAWLEIPAGATPDTLSQMIESHFGASSCQVDTLLWVV